MKIPEEKIEQIKQATDILDLVSQYVTLKKRGKSFVGLCPFHTEKTPSFTVDPVKGFYHCFGCGAGGNVFTFLMEIEKVSFPEAVETLAKRAGISLEISKEDDARVKQAEVLYRANQMAEEFFIDCLFKTNAGERALNYLSERGFYEDLIRKFKVGYSPNRWDGLIQKASRENVKVEHLLKAGLVTKSQKSSGYYDRFRGRIMFPIHMPSGRTVGFGGRIMKDEKNSPKYLNSPETLIYKKSSILYGLYYAKESIRKHDRVIVVEGYTDVMRMHQHGFENVVASSGTAFTIDHANIIRRYTHNVTLLFDGDSAGLKAALRSADILIKSGLDVFIAPLDKGEDPDTYLRQKGKEALAELLEKSVTFFNFYFDRLEKDGRLKTPKQKSFAVSSLLDRFAPLLEYQERALLIKDIAEKLGIDERPYFRKYLSAAGIRGDNDEEEAVSFSLRRASEEGIIRSLLYGTVKIRKNIFKFLEPGEIVNPDIKRIYSVVKDKFGSNPDFLPENIIDLFADKCAEMSLLTGLEKEQEESEHIFQFALDCVLKIKEMNRKSELESARKKILEMQSAKKSTEQLLKKYNQIKLDLRNERETLKKEWAKKDKSS